MENKKEAKANKILADGFRKLGNQIMKSDAKTIADNIGMSPFRTRQYLQGKVKDFNTGSIILTELKKIIKEREDFALELVA